jgi:hypothetical protein
MDHRDRGHCDEPRTVVGIAAIVVGTLTSVMTAPMMFGALLLKPMG